MTTGFSDIYLMISSQVMINMFIFDVALFLMNFSVICHFFLNYYGQDKSYIHTLSEYIMYLYLFFLNFFFCWPLHCFSFDLLPLMIGILKTFLVYMFVFSSCICIEILRFTAFDSLGLYIAYIYLTLKIPKGY